RAPLKRPFPLLPAAQPPELCSALVMGAVRTMSLAPSCADQAPDSIDTLVPDGVNVPPRRDRAGSVFGTYTAPFHIQRPGMSPSRTTRGPSSSSGILAAAQCFTTWLTRSAAADMRTYEPVSLFHSMGPTPTAYMGPISATGTEG